MFDMENYLNNEKEYLDCFKKSNEAFDEFLDSLNTLAVSF